MPSTPLSPRRRSALTAALLIVIGLVLLTMISVTSGSGFVAHLISRALSTPTTKVSIGAIDGLLSSDVTIRDITIADREGAWLSVDRVHILWNPLALFRLKVSIETLDIPQMEIQRKPASDDRGASGTEPFGLPQLPVAVEVAQFSLANVSAGAPVLGTPARFSVKGTMHLGSARGLGLMLDIVRRDRPGKLAARLDFVPKSKALGARLDLEEPAGGILAEMAGLPNRPPVALAFTGEGTLDAFRAKIAFDAGPAIGADGTLACDREGTVRKLALDLAARASGLLPDMLAPIFAGTTKVDGVIAVEDDGTVHVPRVAMVAAAARLDVTGRRDADGSADIAISGANIANTERGTVLRGAEIERLALEARLKGALDAPSLDATLTVETARLPSLSFERLSAKLAADPRKAISAGTGLLDLSADAEATGLTVGNAAVAEAIGNEVRLTMRGSGRIDGPIDIEAFRVVSPTLSSELKGRFGAADATGRLEVETHDLSRFGRLAGLALGGDAKLTADIEGAPASRRFAARIDAAAHRLATGMAQIDGLTGGEIRLAGRVRYDLDAGFRADDLSLTGLHANARIDGAVGPEAADLTGLVTIPVLDKADKRLSGRGEATAHVTGPLERPDATLTARIIDGTMLGRAVPRLALEAHATDLLGALEAEANLDGTIGGKVTQGRVRAARLQNGETRIDKLDLGIGSVAVTGAGTVDAAILAAGKLSIHARDLDDLSPLLLEKLSGMLDADVTFTRSGARQGLAVEAAGEKIAGFGMGLAKLSASLAAADLYRRPVLSGSVQADEARIGGETITRLRLDAKEAPAASDVTLTALARGVGFEARGRITPSDPVRIDLSQLDARRGRTRIGLAGPAAITIEDGGATIRNFVVTMNGGRLSVDGRAGPRSDLKVAARAVPLSVADLVAPDLGLGGTLDGEAAVAGALGALSGPYRLRLSNLVTAQTRAAGLPPIAAEAEGRLEGAQAVLEATIAAGEAGRMTVTGTAPLAAGGTLDLALKGNLDAAGAGRAMAVEGRRVAGAVAIDGRVTGTLERPKAAGTAVLSNGSYQDAVQGTRLDAIRARLVARDDRIDIESATATARNGGEIALSGDIRLDPAAGFPGSVKIVGRRAEIVRSSITTAIVDLDLALTGPLARSPHLGGKVGIETLDVSIPEVLPGAGRPLEGTRHIRPTPTARQRLALAAARRKGTKGAAPFDAALDVTVDVPGRILVTGRGLDTELGGSLKVQGTLAEPKPVGAFHLVRGRMRILASQLDFTRANLTFAGDLSPQLDFLATTQAGGASIRVAVTGNPSDPQFTFTSSPDYPQDEVLSRLLFGQGSGRLTPTQALALAQAVAIYSGGTSALESLRRSLGLGDTSGSRNPLTNWLGDRASLGIRTGATPAQTGVGMDISIWKQLKARGTIDARGAASVGAGAEYEW